MVRPSSRAGKCSDSGSRCAKSGTAGRPCGEARSFALGRRPLDSPEPGRVPVDSRRHGSIVYGRETRIHLDYSLPRRPIPTQRRGRRRAGGPHTECRPRKRLEKERHGKYNQSFTAGQRIDPRAPGGPKFGAAA